MSFFQSLKPVFLGVLTDALSQRDTKGTEGLIWDLRVKLKELKNRMMGYVGFCLLPTGSTKNESIRQRRSSASEMIRHEGEGT